MHDKFNPYQAWLGIPPVEQPPNHYRLLGIPLFEDDHRAINAAAERQLTRVGGAQSSSNSAIARHVIEQINAARRVLLAHDAKRGYDRALKEKLSIAPSVATAPIATKYRPHWRAMAGVAGVCLLAVVVIGIALPKSTPNSAQAPGIQSERDRSDALTTDKLAAPQAATEAAAEAGDGIKAATPAHEQSRATLADGTVLDSEPWGEYYEGYDWCPPINATDAETLVDYEKAGLESDVRLRGIRLDVAGGRMYWIGESAKVMHIRSADLDGGNIRTVVDLPFKYPMGLAIDTINKKIYWTTNRSSSSEKSGKALWRANFDGSEPQAVFTGLRQPGAVAVEPKSKHIYYFENTSLVRSNLDGSGEARILTAEITTGSGSPSTSVHSWAGAAIDLKRGKLCWAGSGVAIARANLDGSALQIIVPKAQGHGEISGLAIDGVHDRLYFVDRTYGDLWRSDTDGSNTETVAVGLFDPTGLDVDPENEFLYWTERKLSGNSGYGVVRRVRAPAALLPLKKPSPPKISALTPIEQKRGGEVSVTGASLGTVQRVEFVTAPGETTGANFKIISDSEVAVTIPDLGNTRKRVTILLRNLGGVGVGFPRESRVVSTARTAFDRFRDGAVAAWVLTPNTWAAGLERTLILAQRSARLSLGDRGGNTLFLKDGSAMVANKVAANVIYHEPFTIVHRRWHASPETIFVPVPAIRTSILEKSFEYAPD